MYSAATHLASYSDRTRFARKMFKTNLRKYLKALDALASAETELTNALELLDNSHLSISGEYRAAGLDYMTYDRMFMSPAMRDAQRTLAAAKERSR